MAKIIFYLKSEKFDKQGKVSLLAQITNDYKSYRIRLGKVKPRHWNKKDQRLKLTSLSDKEYSDNVSLNKIIDTFEAQAKDLFSKALLQKRKLNEAEIKGLMTMPDPSIVNRSNSFFDVFDDFIEANKTDKALRTIMGYTTVKNFLARFEKDTKKDITWDSFDPSFVDRLKKYTFTVQRKQQGYYAKIVRVLATFLHWAKERNYYQGNIFDKLKAEEPEKEVIFLSMDELMSLFNYHFKAERLIKTRDLFCFACFTGLRYSDVISLNREHLNGKVLIKSQIKTGEVKSIPLNKFALSILSKYKDEPHPLPRILGQKLNLYIKECCKIIAEEQPSKEGFNRLIIKKTVIGSETIEQPIPLHQAITFHVARKTFITNSIMLGLNIKVLQEMGAPKKEKDLRKYLKITDAFKSKEMDRSWNALS